jgi:hypothetical protein
MSHSHPAVQAVRAFNRESDQIERECNELAADLKAGRITEAEFDRRAAEILVGDYVTALEAEAITNPAVEPRFNVGDRVFSHYTGKWGSIERIDHRGTDADGREYTTWYEVRADDGTVDLLDDHDGQWTLARIVPPRIATRYGYGEDPRGPRS